jgi:hypothetical protein
MSGMTRNWLILNTRSQEERWHHIMYSGLGTRRGNDQLLLPGDRWDEKVDPRSRIALSYR